jgi:hypothetical protein
MNETLKQSISNEFRNTKMGFIRIKKNLHISNLSDDKIESYTDLPKLGFLLLGL